jgi:hypothetical protein
MPESGDDCKNCKYVEKRKAVSKDAEKHFMLEEIIV